LILGRYLLAPVAEDDLSGIGRYYRRKASRAVARDVVHGIRAKCQFLADTPGTIGHSRDDLRPGVRTMTVPPHIIYFRYAAGGIEVVRILHEAQDAEAEFAY
jgi:plasmid stabilization system protein ParE